MLRRLLSGALLLLLAAQLSAASSGFRYRAVTRSTIDGGGQQSMLVEALAAGSQAKIVFKESSNPMFLTGTYLLMTTDGLFLVNERERTYSRWDLEALLGMVGGVMQSMGGVVKMEVSDPKVEKLLEKDGGTILGYSTTHYRYRTTYDMVVRVMGMSRGDRYVIEQDSWLTDELEDEGFGVWLANVPRKTGYEPFDKLIAAEFEKAQGFVLRSVQKTTAMGLKRRGRVTTTIVEMSVDSLEETEIPPGTFDLDPTFTEVPMMPIPGAWPPDQPPTDEPREERPEEEEEGGIFKRLRKGMGGG